MPGRIVVKGPCLVAVAILLGTACNVGCILPYPIKETSDARPGKSTVGESRAHVFRTSGLPDASTPDGRFYLYRFSRKSGVGLAALTPHGAGSSSATHFSRGRLLLEFDAAGRVKEKRIHKCGKDADPFCGWGAAGVEAEGEMWSMIEKRLGQASAADYRSSLSSLVESAARFHEAVDAGDASRAVEWLDLGVDANTVDRELRLPIGKAAGGGHVALLRLLIQRGAVVDARNREGETPLHLASRAGHIEAVRLLLDSGADIQARGRWDSTPLHLAAFSGNGKLVEVLLEYGASRKTKDQYGRRPADVAVFTNHDEILPLLER